MTEGGCQTGHEGVATYHGCHLPRAVPCLAHVLLRTLLVAATACGRAALSCARATQASLGQDAQKCRKAPQKQGPCSQSEGQPVGGIAASAQSAAGAAKRRLLERMRPIHELRIWISEGLT